MNDISPGALRLPSNYTSITRAGFTLCEYTPAADRPGCASQSLLLIHSVPP